MTNADLHSSSTDIGGPQSRQRDRKSVLFCPVCGHDSPPDGDWVVTTEESHQTFRCPTCEQVVAVR